MTDAFATLTREDLVRLVRFHEHQWNDVQLELARLREIRRLAVAYMAAVLQLDSATAQERIDELREAVEP